MAGWRSPLQRLRLTASERYLMAGARNGRVGLWDLRTRRRVVRHPGGDRGDDARV